MSDQKDATNIQGGASLLVAWQLKDKPVVVIGGGDVASGRIQSLLAADAFITVVAPRAGLHPLTASLIAASPRITHLDRTFAGADDLAGAAMVLTAIDDVATSREIADLCRARRIPVNAADIPPSCDFYFGSQIRDGPLQVLVSTNGQSPKLASLIRQRVQAALPRGAGAAIERVGALRAALKERAPGVGGDVGRRRMRWMVGVCTQWDMDDLARLDEEMIAKLLDEGWERDRVPSVREVGGRRSWTPKVALSMSPVSVAALSFASGVAATVILLLAFDRLKRR